jgi:hypothetical protein
LRVDGGQELHTAEGEVIVWGKQTMAETEAICHMPPAQSSDSRARGVNKNPSSATVVLPETNTPITIHKTRSHVNEINAMKLILIIGMLVGLATGRSPTFPKRGEFLESIIWSTSNFESILSADLRNYEYGKRHASFLTVIDLSGGLYSRGPSLI